MLVSTSELAAHLNDPTWVIFDCRHDLMDKAKGLQLYSQGHIPGAFFARVETDLSGEKSSSTGRHPLPSRESMLAFLAGHGVTPETQVVAYDDSGGFYGARLWWLCRWLGLTRVALLDGGLNLWTAEKRPLSTAVPTPTPTTPFAAKETSMSLVTSDEVFKRLGDTSTLVIDARAAERYRGDVEPIDRVAGHIPGAINRFFKLNLNPDLTFRSAKELRSEFEAALKGVKPGKVAHQCGSGITACANLFAMEYAGLTGSQLYAGSWSEWITDPARPVTQEPKPTQG